MKQKILDKSVEMFLKYGVKTVTMDDIAKEIAISKKTFYKYFDNKKILVEETTDEIFKSSDEIVSQVKEQNYSSIKENFEINKIFKKAFGNVGTSYLFQLEKYYPETYKEVMENQSISFSECVKNNIEKGIEEGFYRKDFNIDVIVGFYLSLIIDIHKKDLLRDEVVNLEYEALLYHARSICTPKGIKELEYQVKENQL